jgi:cytochrome c5
MLWNKTNSCEMPLYTTPATEETIMLKSFLLFTAAVLLVCTSVLAPARPPQEAGTGSAAKGSAKASTDTHAKAKKLYDLDCALCHGATGDGKTDLAKDMQLTLLDWTDPKSLAGMSDQALFDAIRKGKGKMPPEDDARAKNDDVRNLVNYIRKLAKDQPVPAPQQPAAAPAPSPAPEPSTAPPPAAAPAPGK